MANQYFRGNADPCIMTLKFTLSVKNFYSFQLLTPAQKYCVTIYNYGVNCFFLNSKIIFRKKKTPQVLKEWKTTKPSSLPMHSSYHVLGDNPHLLNEEKVAVPSFQRSEL